MSLNDAKYFKNVQSVNTVAWSLNFNWMVTLTSSNKFSSISWITPKQQCQQRFQLTLLPNDNLPIMIELFECKFSIREFQLNENAIHIYWPKSI